MTGTGRRTAMRIWRREVEGVLLLLLLAAGVATGIHVIWPPEAPVLATAVPDCVIVDCPLHDALARISGWTNTSVDADWTQLKSIGVSRDSLVCATIRHQDLRGALDLILFSAGGDFLYEVAGRHIRIVPSDNRVYCAVYDVHDLVAAYHSTEMVDGDEPRTPEEIEEGIVSELVRTIGMTIQQKAWVGTRGGSFDIRAAGTSMMVCQTAPGHDALRHLLRSLREQRRLIADYQKPTRNGE